MRFREERRGEGCVEFERGEASLYRFIDGQREDTVATIGEGLQASYGSGRGPCSVQHVRAVLVVVMAGLGGA